MRSYPLRIHALIVLGFAAAAFGPKLVRSVLVAGPSETTSSEARYEVDLSLLESSSRVFESVAGLVSPAVVYVEARIVDDNDETISEESGSGILVRPDGFGRAVVMTNEHVIADADPARIDVLLADGRLFHPTRVWRDRQTDIALLDLAESDLPAAKMGASDQVRIGQWVLAIGSPFGLMQSVTHGIISAKDRRSLGLPGDLRIQEFLQTDAPINPGNSGGPLVDLRGEVIGINTAIASQTGSSSGVAFSIPIDLARWVAEELLRHGKVRRAYLGVGFANRFDGKQAQRLGLPLPRGALVGLVHESGPAEKAGMRTDDVVLSFNQRVIDDENHLINVVGMTPIGETVEVIVWRDRGRRTLRVMLGSWDDFQHVADAPAEDRPDSR